MHDRIDIGLAMGRHRQFGGEFAEHLPFWWEQPDRAPDIVDALTSMSRKPGGGATVRRPLKENEL